MRTQRSGAITPRRAACARSKREVWVGNRSVTWRAISAPVAVMPMKIGPGPGADRGARLLAERGVRLVADHDRVGARDLAGVAHEPLVGLDGDRAVGAVLWPEQRRRDALLVAAVAQLAEELVDEVAPVGQDQHAAGPRGLDEAERGDGLAGAGRVLEPEALGGVGILGLLGELLLIGRQLGVLLVPVGERRLGLGAVELGLELRVTSSTSSSSSSASSAGARSKSSSSSSSSSSAGSSSSSSSSSKSTAPRCARSVVGSSGLLAPRRRGSRRRRARRRAPLPLAPLVGLGQQRRQRARQRIDLVGREHRAVGELRLLLRQHALEAEQQRELAPPRASRGPSGRRRAPPAPGRARAGAACRARARPRAPRRGARTARA